MNEAPRTTKPVPCQDVVEQITAYLDDELPGDVRRGIDAHLEACGDCARILAQWRKVIGLTGRLADDELGRLDPDVRAELLAAFQAQPSTAPD
jgi:anti-sigma factor RsiW